MKSRSKIKINLKFYDKLIEGICLISLLIIWFIVIFEYRYLPEIIPIHFDISGQADRFGDKANIFVLPLITTILCLSISIANQYPHIFHSPKVIVKENVLEHYTNSSKMLRYLKLTVVLILGHLNYKIIEKAKGNIHHLGNWYLPLTLTIILLPLIYFIIRSFKIK